MRISDWSSDVWSSDFLVSEGALHARAQAAIPEDCHWQGLSQRLRPEPLADVPPDGRTVDRRDIQLRRSQGHAEAVRRYLLRTRLCDAFQRSEEHTSELQSLMCISYAVFCLKKKTTIKHVELNR